jgi:hypothetical protein
MTDEERRRKPFEPGRIWRSDPSDNAEDEEPDPSRPSPFRVIRQATALCYDTLGLTVIVSFISFLALSLLWLLAPPGLFGPSPLAQLVRIGLLAVPAYGLLAGPAFLACRSMRRDDPGPLDLPHGWRRYGLAGCLLGLFNGAAGVLLAGDALVLLAQPNPFLRLLAIPFAYLLLFWLSSQLYQFPLLILRGRSPARAFGQAHLLALANPAFTGVLAFVMILLAGLSLVVWLLPVLVMPVWTASVGYCALEALLRKYEGLEPPEGHEGRSENRASEP